MSLPAIALTTPLYYVNDLPHIGSAYPTIAADALARFYRMKGHPVRLITGTDEHGQKIQRAAEQNHLLPQEHCDRMVAAFQALWQKLNISYDAFSRTTDPNHEAIVYQFFQRVLDSGDIYLGQQQGWYCVACEEFKEEKDLIKDRHCPIHTNIACEFRDEGNYFFRLSKYQTQLEQLYRDRPDFIQPEIRRNEVLNFVSQGLTDFSISRVNLTWGFPLPNDYHHTIYVWFDALLGYITALLEPDTEATLENAIAKMPFKLHIIGKDILRFHAIYFPAMLISAGLPIPEKVFGHGFLTKDGLKMGKTTGNTIDPTVLCDRYGADAMRYYFLREIEFGKDGDFNEERYVAIVNADLANSLGNLLNRSLGMVGKYCHSLVPNPSSQEIIDLTSPIVALASDLSDRVALSYENLNFQLACEQILDLIRDCNKLIDDVAPWKLFKLGQQAAINECLYTVLESVRIATYLLSPITPHLSELAYQQLGLELNIIDSWQEITWGKLQTGAKLSTPQPIFQRLELVSS
jgi:methionyl-tRNA synthetase